MGIPRPLFAIGAASLSAVFLLHCGSDPSPSSSTAPDAGKPVAEASADSPTEGATGANERPLPGVLAYWGFEGTVDDAVGANNGILAGAHFETGIYGSALDCGNDEYAQIGDNLDMGTQSFSIAGFILLSDFNNKIRAAIAKGATLGFTNDPSAGYVIGYDDNTDDLLAVVGDGASRIEARWHGAIDADFHFVGLVLDRATKNLRLYLDRNEVATSPIGELGSVDSTKPLRFCRGDSADDYRGRIDEVRFYDHALSASDVDVYLRFYGK